MIHFAGHSELDDTPGAEQRLLLAPDATTGASGSLLAQEIESAPLSKAQMVVLAGCRTGAGRTSRLEGSLSLARHFLAAGVPSVVASLWDVDDAVGHRFSVAFHRSYLAHRDPALALQQTQAAFSRDPDPAIAHPAAWAGFVVLGGLAPASAPPAVRATGSL